MTAVRSQKSLGTVFRGSFCIRRNNVVIKEYKTPAPAAIEFNVPLSICGGRFEVCFCIGCIGAYRCGIGVLWLYFFKIIIDFFFNISYTIGAGRYPLYTRLTGLTSKRHVMSPALGPPIGRFFYL